MHSEGETQAGGEDSETGGMIWKQRETGQRTAEMKRHRERGNGWC